MKTGDSFDYLIITKITAKIRMATIAAAISITCKSTLAKSKRKGQAS